MRRLKEGIPDMGWRLYDGIRSLRLLFSKSLAILSMEFFPHSGICHVKSIKFYIRRKKRRKLQRKMLLFYSILRILLRNVRHWHLRLTSHCLQARDVEQNIRFCIHAFAGFLVAQVVKNSPCSLNCDGLKHWGSNFNCVLHLLFFSPSLFCVGWSLSACVLLVLGS